VTLVLKEKGPKTVYSGDLKSEDPQVGPVHETIPLIKLREGEEVKLEAVTQLGIGLEHAKWQPTTSCAYKHYPQITIDPDLCEACGKCAEECPRGVLKFEEDKNQVLVVDAENCSMCKTCLKDCESEAIQIGVEEGKFIFRIETDGSLPPEKVISTACDVLSEKSDKIITFLEEGGS
jgi:DNA-directed RNA polymerase subunit D